MSHNWIHYIPILTTLISAAFSLSLFRRYRERRTPQYLWWAVGIAFYGLGTLIESAITLSGNSVFLNKAWYIAGALWGGYPLAQGSLYLSYSRRFANRMTAVSLPFVVAASVLVCLSPVIEASLQPHRPSGAILGWSWIRLLSPFINLYAVIFLIGGAALSAWHYWQRGDSGHRAAGNSLIAFGALLPGVGGAMAKAGIVEALYIGEFLGIILIWIGERLCSVRRQSAAEAIPVPSQSV